MAKLAELMGGRDKVVGRLDASFAAFFDRTGPSGTRFDPTTEPDIQTPWMYDYLAVPSKTQATVRRLVNQLWANTADGATAVEGIPQHRPGRPPDALVQALDAHPEAKAMLAVSPRVAGVAADVARSRTSATTATPR